jgi:anti-repressor protein
VNNLDILHNGIISMSSREISELTCKQHQHVKRDIKKQLIELNIDESKYGHMYLDYYKREQYEFKLDYDQTMILVSGYSISLRAKIIMRWTELENKFKPEPPTQLQLAKQVVELLEQQQTNAPKVDFYNQVTESKDTIPMGQVAKVLNIKGIGRNTLFNILRGMSILMHNNDPYQRYINQGYFRIIEQKYNKPCGETGISFKTIVYQKGLVFIQKKVKEYLDSKEGTNGSV